MLKLTVDCRLSTIRHFSQKCSVYFITPPNHWTKPPTHRVKDYCAPPAHPIKKSSLDTVRRTTYNVSMQDTMRLIGRRHLHGAGLWRYRTVGRQSLSTTDRELIQHTQGHLHQGLNNTPTVNIPRPSHRGWPVHVDCRLCTRVIGISPDISYKAIQSSETCMQGCSRLRGRMQDAYNVRISSSKLYSSLVF